MSERIHVVPIDDLREHEISPCCWCCPEEDEYGLVIHNALDKREAYERGELRLQ